ncbi:MAG: alpha/beta fold hydrolase [Thaumarchaeota archaeon]|nr:alpha/beta fold hydrolase [Nitrososphaerota archaeon]
MLLALQMKEFYKKSEVSNPYYDYWYRWFSFATRYNSALVGASVKAFMSFLNAKGTAQKIENNIRVSFDNALRENLKDDGLVSSMNEFVESWLKLVSLTGHRQFASNFYNLVSYENKFLEPLRDNINRTSSELVETKGRFNMLHYKSEDNPKQKTPLLVVYSLINRYYILDLLPKVSVIKNLQSQGFDIYATDWGTPAAYDEDLSLETYAEEYIGNAIEKIKERTGCEKVSLFGYCWGGIFALIYSALHQDNVKNLILHATPVDIEKEKTVIEKWTSHLSADELVDACGNVPGWLLNLAFILRNPVETMLKYTRYFSEPRTLDEIEQFFSIETWLYDSRPIIGEVYREIVDQVYKDNLLIKNKMRVGSETINLKSITIPILDIVGISDDLVPPSSSKSIIDVIGSTDKKLIEFPIGHVGLCISQPAHEKLWPEVGKWLSERS